jgi:hypothetical protein
MARRSSRSDQPQSNTVLIVFLVFSILLNLGLGIFLYLAQDKVANAEKEKSDANNTRQGVEKQRDAATNVYIPLLLRMIGDKVSNEKMNTIKQELPNALTALPQDWYGGSIWKDLLGRTQGDPGLVGPPTDPIGTPTISLADQIRKLTAEREQLNRKLKDTEVRFANLNTEFQTYQKQWNAQDYSAKLKAAQDAFETDLKNKIKQKDDVIAELNKRMQDITNDVQKQFTDATNEQKKRLAEAQTSYDASIKALQLERKEEKEKAQADRIVNLNAPKGHIVSVAQGGIEAYIDLGSNSKLPLQTTFAVHGRDANGNPNPKPKAEVEVTNIVGPQMARVRIKRMARHDAERLNLNPENTDYWTTDSRDFVRSPAPLFKGDFLYNTVWDPNRKIHVALVGEFDLDGDGTDDIQALMGILRNQGAEVDLYLDKANGYQPRGKLDFSTDILVVGGLNVITKSANANEALATKGTDLIRNTEKVQREALEKGIEIMTLPRFLTRMGLNTPKSLSPRPGLDVSTPAAENLPANPPAANPPGGNGK